MESTSTVSSPVDAPARLSSAQKRDLFGQAVAAVITTALIAAPLIVPGAVRETGTWGEAALPAHSFAGPVAAVALADAPSSQHLSVVARPSQVTGTSGTARAASDVPRRAARKPISRRLTGWLVGDGAHAIRPFPTVASSRP